MSKKTNFPLTVIGVLLVVIAVIMLLYSYMLPAVDGTSTAAKKKYSCDIAMTWSILGGSELNSARCVTVGKCSLLDFSSLGGSGKNLITMRGSDYDLRSGVDLSILSASVVKEATLCTKDTSGVVRLFDESGKLKSEKSWGAI